jgi:hypothetical protein
VADRKPEPGPAVAGGDAGFGLHYNRGMFITQARTGFSEIGGPEALGRFLPQSDFVAICCQWTPETTRSSTKTASRR